MERELVCLLVCVAVTVGQTFPYFSHSTISGTTAFTNRTFIDRGIISIINPLKCLTSHTPCCVGAGGGWVDPEGTTVQVEATGATAFYVSTTNEGGINLHRFAATDGDQLSGMYECQIPGPTGVIESVFIYLGVDGTGRLTSAVVSFTSLLTEVNTEEPEFMLTCRSEGGPATSVQWTRNSSPLTEEDTSLVLVDRRENTVYESRLTVRGRLLGPYTCTVSSNRDDFFGEAGSSSTSEPLTVTEAGEPTRLNAIDLLANGEILVTWNPPSGEVTGYRVFLEPGTVEEDVVATATSYTFQGLLSGTGYTVSIVALSGELPSEVVGPIAPSSLTAPSVTLSSTSSPPRVGEDLALTCVVVVPDDLVILGNPHIEFRQPAEGSSAQEATSIPPSGSTFIGSYTFPDLGLASRGNFSCSATYSISSGDATSTSPAGTSTLYVPLTLSPANPTVGISDSRVPYLSNSIAIFCNIFLAGLTTNDVQVEFSWSRVGGAIPGSASISDNEILVDGMFVRQTLMFGSLVVSDSGEYDCEVVITPRVADPPLPDPVPAHTASDSFDLAVITPVLVVAAEPTNQRVLDHGDFDNFSISCSASATASGTSLELDSVLWERSLNSGSFQPVSSSSYTPLTGSPGAGYLSQLTGTESLASSTVMFRCMVPLPPGNTLSETSTSTITVQGPANPGRFDARPTNVQDTQAMVVWTVSSIAYTPETYVVLYGTDRDTLDRTSVEETSGNDISVQDALISISLTGLQPEAAYFFRVNASNSFGSTLYDIASFNTSVRRPDPPTDLRVMEGTPGSYIFSWGPSPSLPLSRPVVSYTLSCDPSLSGVGDSEVHTPNNSTTSASLSLSPGLRYTCCVWATSDGGVAPSNRTCLNNILTTPPAVPAGPPLEFTAMAASRNLSLSWSPPLPALRNGDISSYIITCSSSPSSDISLSTADTATTVTGLSPDTLYSCSVAARNPAGTGPATDTSTTTLEDAPDSAPREFTYTVTNGSSDLQFNWVPPPSSETNGVIVGYTIICNSSLVFPAPSSPLLVTSLTPGSLFSCSISASTAVGAGPRSSPALLVLTVPSAPEVVGVSEEGEGLLVNWEEVGGVVNMYKVGVARLDRGNTVVLFTMAPPLLVLSEKVGGYERVNVSVAAVNMAGFGPYSEPQFARTPSIPPGPVGGLDVNKSLRAQWVTPELPNGILTAFLVSVETFEGGVVKLDPVMVDNMTFSYQLNNSSLVAGTPYNVVVVAVNERGEGNKSYLLFYTQDLPAAGIPLSAEGLTRDSSNGDILLSWKKPSPVQARGYIVGYEIRFAEAMEKKEGGGRRRREECSRDQCVLGRGQTSGCCQVGPNTTMATISGLENRKSYEVSVSVVNRAGVGEMQTFTVAGMAVSEDDGSPLAIVVGATVGGLVVILLLILTVVIIIIILCLHRRKNKTGDYRAYPSRSSPSLDEKMESGKGTEMVSLSAVIPSSTNPSSTNPSSVNPSVSPERAARMRPIELGEFEQHVWQMHQDRDKGFELEYQTFSTEPEAPHEVAKNDRNKAKNRFANIFPYDQNRVRLLEMDGVEGFDYINASFVDGYSRSNAYIGAQGPMSGTVLDFWRMVWEHRPATIVMLTKQIEGGKRRCEVYWPEKVGETFNAGSGIHVVYSELVPFADFEIKKFLVKNVQKPSMPELEVKHFQFLSWPDHGVPKFATSLISFIRRLRLDHNPQSAMVVHCTAGVGRTGAFILLDSMLERIASERTVNVYEFLTHMRQQRVHLVQTLAQYVFVHDALVELITCGDTSVSSQLRDHIARLHKTLPEKDISGFTEQFRLLARVSRRPTDSDNSDALEPYNVDKNRYSSRVPYNMNRVRLKPTGVTGGEYINASFLDGYKLKNAYMAAQAPLSSTVGDFWRMVWEFRSRAIVMLCQLKEDGQEMSHQYWPEQPGARQSYGKNTVTLVSEEHTFGAKEIVVRKFEISDDKNTSAFTVTQYHVLCWPEKGRMDTKLLIQVLPHLNTLQRKTENKPITVVCNDGMGRTGAFICVHAMLERMKSEHVVDFFQFIKSSRINRPDIVREEEHYIMCHEAVADYLDSFQTYANFA